MKSRFLLSIILTMPLVFFILLELLIIGPLKQENYFIDSLVRARLATVKCVIVGDSHPASSFRSVVKDRCANLATGGASTWMVIDLLESVSKHNELETVVMSIAPHYFASYRIHNRSDGFRKIAEWLTPFPNPMSQNEVVIGFLINWFKDKLGFSKLKTESQLEVKKKRLEQHNPINDFYKSDLAIAYKKMVQSLINRGTNVCVIRTPVISDYERLLSTKYNSEDWNSFIDDLDLLGAKFIHYNDVMDNYPLELFANPEHLNQIGAELYAPKLLDICLNKQN